MDVIEEREDFFFLYVPLTQSEIPNLLIQINLKKDEEIIKQEELEGSISGNLKIWKDLCAGFIYRISMI